MGRSMSFGVTVAPKCSTLAIDSKKRSIMTKIRLAIIGCGGNSGAHARRLRGKEEVEIVACCDVSEEIVSNYIGNHLSEHGHSPASYTDLSKLLDETEPDAVMISTPHSLHFEQAMASLEAGCHVLVEKPMVTSLDHAYQLADKVTETGKILVIGYNTPCTPEFDHLRELIRKGDLGRLEMVTGYVTQNWTDYTAGTWRQEPSLSGGGQAYDTGAHLLNSLCWSVESDVSEVFAYLDNHGTKVDVNSVINVRFVNGVLASMAVSGNCGSVGSDAAFIFEGGRVEIDGWSGTWIRIYDRNGQQKYPLITGQPQTPDDNFIDAIMGRAEPRTTPQNGIVQSQLMDCIYESARTGKPAKPKAR